MRSKSTTFLKMVIYGIALGTLAICTFVFPRTMGSDDVHGYRPILVGMYLTAIPFFFALWQGLKLLGYIDKKVAFSDQSIKALKTIKWCAVAVSSLYGIGVPYIVEVAQSDDAPGVVALGLMVVFASLVIATFSAVLQTLLQSAIDIKTENDLTV